MLNFDNVADTLAARNAAHDAMAIYCGCYDATVDTALRAAIAAPDAREEAAQYIATHISERIGTVGARLAGERLFESTRESWEPALLASVRLMVAECVEFTGEHANF